MHDVAEQDRRSVMNDAPRPRAGTGVLGTLTVSQVAAGRRNRLWFELDGAHRGLASRVSGLVLGRPRAAQLPDRTNQATLPP